MKTAAESRDGNPIIKDVYTADTTVIVYEDKVYLYTGHDEPPARVNNYVMNDWLCFSSQDLDNWQAHGPLLKAVDFYWASGDAYASKMIQRDNQFFGMRLSATVESPGKPSVWL